MVRTGMQLGGGETTERHPDNGVARRDRNAVASRSGAGHVERHARITRGGDC
jgi:hypothetical protein